MDGPKRVKFVPKRLRDNEKYAKEMEQKIRFQCSYCNSNYARKASLITHVKQKHQEVSSQQDTHVKQKHQVNKDKFSEND